MLAELLITLAGWSVFTFVVAVAAQRIPPGWLTARAPRRDRRGRRFYDLVGVRRWKGRLPDGSTLVPGALGKRHLDGRDPASLSEFAVEIRRAQVAHWASLGAVPVLWLRVPAIGGALVAAVAMLVNGPCLIALGYNRDRIDGLLDLGRDRRRPGAMLGR